MPLSQCSTECLALQALAMRVLVAIATCLYEHIYAAEHTSDATEQTQDDASAMHMIQVLLGE